MKTLTEFTAFGLKQAVQTQASLTQQGKTPEELPAAMGEAMKMEGDRLSYLMGALEVISSKGPKGPRTEDLKRVLVFSIAEGDKVPHGALVKEADGKKTGYMAEYYPSLQKNSGPSRQTDKPGENFRGKKGDRGKKGKGPRRQRGQLDPSRSHSEPAPAGAQMASDQNSQGHGEIRRPRRNRPPRPPRVEEPAKKLPPLALDDPKRFVVAPRATPLPVTVSEAPQATSTENASS